MKKYWMITILILTILVICSVQKNTIESKELKGKNVRKEKVVDNGTITVEHKRISKQQIHTMVEQYFPQNLIEDWQRTESFLSEQERKKGPYREKSFIEIDLDDKEIKRAQIPSVEKEKEEKLAQNEIVILYSNSYWGIITVLKRIGENYIKQWESLKMGGYHGNIEEIRDINNDGQKEIIVSWAVGMKWIPHIWIYSWDGTKGNLISPKGIIEGFSGLIASAGFRCEDDIKDLDSDKIDEVITYNYIYSDEGGSDPIGIEREIYKWNPDNQMYELWKTELEKGKRRQEVPNE